MQKEEISERVSNLRMWMKEHSLDAFVFPTTDPHFGEYTPKHWETRKWISGFTGSAGIAVITSSKAALWTDSRYFLQAEKQIAGTPFVLMKERMPETPSPQEWLSENLLAGMTVGIDGWVNSINGAENMENYLADYSIKTETAYDPAQILWNNRPNIPEDKVFIHPIEYSGIDTTEKIKQIRSFLEKNNAEGIFISTLDDIAWTLNLRGSDTHCNPVFVSYLLISLKEIVLYINKVKLTNEAISYLTEKNIIIKEYSEVANDLKNLYLSSIVLDSNLTSISIKKTIPSHCKIINMSSPVPYFKAIKNEQEIKGFHSAMIKDGVAMVRFLIWLEQNAKSGHISEIDIDKKLLELRSEQNLFCDISFDTIAAYKSHAAIVHYEASSESNVFLKPQGMLLLDSGAQYKDGTTDITRTIALGSLSEEEKRDYTLVLKGHISLSSAVFPEGTCGTQLDILARSEMWKEGINYGHGTGHGVGSYLCVHEGPHQIRMNNIPAALQPGMTVTDEPGIYKEGRYGIRIENTLLIVPYKTTEFGNFYQFEPLTLCPIDTKPILVDRLTDIEKLWLNEYHRNVFTKLSPYLKKKEIEWLQEATKPIN